jgi:hypothetical protein
MSNLRRAPTSGRTPSSSRRAALESGVLAAPSPPIGAAQPSKVETIAA